MVKITIKTKVIGTTTIRLITNGAQASDQRKGLIPATVSVPYFEMEVSDNLKDSKPTKYYVTRDAPIYIKTINHPVFSSPVAPFEDLWKEHVRFEIVNTAMEPLSGAGKNVFVGIASDDYPPGSGLFALTLAATATKRTMTVEKNPYSVKFGFRKKEDECSGNAIHVGGIFTHAGDPAGSSRTTGSEGCFTLAMKDSGNAGNKKFKSDVSDRAAKVRKWRKATKSPDIGTPDIQIILEKRDKSAVFLEKKVAFEKDSKGNFLSNAK